MAGTAGPGLRACSPAARSWQCRPSWSSPTTLARCRRSPSSESSPAAADSPPERSHPPHLLELPAVVHALKALRPYPLDEPFELHTDNAGPQLLRESRGSAASVVIRCVRVG